MLARGDMVGVFQVESQGMRRALVDMRPDRFEDIIALVALYRPGPMANIPTYCARKHGDEEPEYLHPVLEPILKETFGVIIYQEQVMQIAQVHGRLFARRRRPAAPRHGQEDPRRDGRSSATIFVAGAVEERRAEGAGRDHLRAAARNSPTTASTRATPRPTRWSSYQTAYMKAHYPVEFIAASMTLDLNNTDKLSEFRSEAQRLGIKVEPPNDQPLRRDLRGRRQDDLLRARGAEGRRHRRRSSRSSRSGPRTACSPRSPTSPRGSIPRAINKRIIESLAAAGAFDTLEPNRARVFAGADCDPRRLPARARGRDHRPERHVRQRGRRADHHAAADRAVAAGRAAAPRI